MPATPLRRDAARNRELILAAAETLKCAGQPLQLNAVAREAGVGVGTVYRHFATPEALGEGLVAGRFAELTDAAREAAATITAGADPLAAFRSFVAEALGVFIADPAFADAAVASGGTGSEATTALRTDLIAAFAGLVAGVEHELRPGLDAIDVLVLFCGLGYSARLRPEQAPAYLDTLLSALLSSEPPR